MFASLHHSLSQSPLEPESGGEYRTPPHEVIGRFAYLIDQLSQDQQLKLLRALFKDKLGKVLLKLFVDIPVSQRLPLMHQLESIILKSVSPNKRKYPRKTCLINASVRAAGPITTSYILDINPYGAYIESSEELAIYQKIKLKFASPSNGQLLSINGRVIWTDSYGVGLKFDNLTPEQLGAIKSFSEEAERVYKINS